MTSVTTSLGDDQYESGQEHHGHDGDEDEQEEFLLGHGIRYDLKRLIAFVAKRTR